VESRMQQVMVLTDGRTLTEIIGPELFSRLMRRAAMYGLPAQHINRLKPWAAGLALSLPVAELERAAAAAGPTRGFRQALARPSGAPVRVIAEIKRASPSAGPIRPGADPAEIARLLPHWPGMSFFAAPIMVKRLAGDPAIAGADLTSLKTIIYGGAPMYLADLEVALDALGPRLAQIYGQGETPMTITALSKADHADRDHPRRSERLQSVGVARTDVEVRVVDDDGTALPAGETGEIVVRGDVVMSGYWEQPEATAEAIRDGWLHTGDVGSFDADGYLTLRDRSKDLIISGGMNIYPREVEEALLRHDGVAAVSVVGRPDPEWGEAVVAFIVAVDAEHPPTVEQLDQLCLERIARYKRPKDYRFVDALPTNNYGKVLKRELRDRLAAE